MSFTGEQVLDLAFGLANVESGNVTASRQLGLLNEVLMRYTRDMGGVDGLHDLNAASTPALTAGVAEYALPAGVEQVDEYRLVAFQRAGGTVWTPLVRVDHRLADHYAAQSGTPWAYYVYYPAGVETFGLLPVPDASAATGTVRRRFRCKPAELTDVSQGITLPPEAKATLAAMLASEFCTLDNNPQGAAIMGAKAREQAARSSETLLDQTLAELNLAPEVLGGCGCVGPDDRRFWGL